MSAKFEIFLGKNGEDYFRLKAANGEIILASEGYKAKASCVNGIESVKKNSVIEARYEKKKSTNGKFFFNLLATNGQIIGTSEMYATEQAREKGIASVTKNAPTAPIVDLTVKK